MTSFFENNEQNTWLPINGLFANLTDFYPEEGFATRGFHSLPTCLSNCTLFSGEKADACKQYCQTSHASFLSSIQDPAVECKKSLDPHCCKDKAGTNEYAFLYCREKMASPRANASVHNNDTRTTRTLLYVLLSAIIIYLVMLVFIFIAKT